MAYSEKVIDHYNNPRNIGTLDKNKKEVGTGLVGAPECGDVMRLQIEVDETTGIIKDAKFKVNTSIMEDQIRVDSKKIDDLQAVIAFCRQNNFDIPLQYINFK